MSRRGPDWVAPDAAKSDAMRRVRTVGTAPEMALRLRLHAAGLRYRVAYPVPGKPRRSIDIAFPRRRLAVFVDGCFWHGCPEHGATPGTNAGFWQRKVEENRRRDSDTDLTLHAAGWGVLRIWAHTGPDEAVAMVMAALAPPGHGDGT